MLTIDRQIEGASATLALAGMLNAASAPELAACANQIPDDVRALTVDCAKLRYTSSAGLRVILALQTRMDDCGGTLVLKNVNGVMMEVFEDTGFVDFLTIE